MLVRCAIVAAGGASRGGRSVPLTGTGGASRGGRLKSSNERERRTVGERAGGGDATTGLRTARAMNSPGGRLCSGVVSTAGRRG